MSRSVILVFTTFGLNIVCFGFVEVKQYQQQVYKMHRTSNESKQGLHSQQCDFTDFKLLFFFKLTHVQTFAERYLCCVIWNIEKRPFCCD